MTRAESYWQLYITVSTAILGAPLLFLPGTLGPMIGAGASDAAWLQLAGTFLLALSLVALTVARKRISDMVMPGVYARLGIVAVLLALALSRDLPFLLLMAGIVLVGVIGSLAARGMAPSAAAAGGAVHERRFRTVTARKLHGR